MEDAAELEKLTKEKHLDKLHRDRITRIVGDGADSSCQTHGNQTHGNQLQSQPHGNQSLHSQPHSNQPHGYQSHSQPHSQPHGNQPHGYQSHNQPHSQPHDNQPHGQPQGNQLHSNTSRSLISTKKQVMGSIIGAIDFNMTHFVQGLHKNPSSKASLTWKWVVGQRTSQHRVLESDLHQHKTPDSAELHRPPKQ